MSRISLFNSPFLLGFDHVERTLDRLAKSGGDGYPPYNIEHVSDNELCIPVAVAGFSTDDLNITVEGNQLIIRGKQTDEEDRVYLHRGIAARQFQRTFVLADGIEVQDADLNSGLLSIGLARPEAAKSVRNVEIKSGGKGKTKGRTSKALTIDHADQEAT